MKKTALLLGFLTLAATGMQAAQQDQTSATVDGLTCEYWNDVHEDGSYWPNWNIAFPDKDGKTYGESARIEYTLTTPSGSKTGSLTPSYFGEDRLSFYSSEGILPAGNYIMKFSLDFLDTEGAVTKSYAYPEVPFYVTDKSNDPKVEMTYTIENGDKTAYFNYALTLKNITKEVASVRVWLDAPGNITIGEANTLSGRIPVDVSAGDVSVWFKSEITFTDGTKMNGVPNDTNVVFKRESSITLPTIELSVSQPAPLTATTGSLDYTLTVTNPENVVDYNIFVVTDGDKAVSDVITTTDLTGTISLFDLNPSGKTPLWVKVYANLTDGTRTDNVQYPGEAQGWNGYEIDTTSTGVEAVEVAEAADVYGIDGRLVGRGLTPAQISMLPKGLYIAAGKKVLVK